MALRSPGRHASADAARSGRRLLDKQAQRLLLKYLRERIAPNNPRDYGEPLRKNLAGLWKYRVGDYRIVADIQDDIVLILILRVGHRRKVYGGH
ncbi:type II toxin-antitoxin system RelE family toxin [Pseudodesulfovibrio pelocollis]|uniref:type II toxin-antitoxin system RelE family toxin n=1 Tax=Pseudodesulfovibrio pelocollis TaxID=3051432 RepID=UPI00255A949E|nr:type II toxin-antitoxin system RelE/ParE family toxin [Pseudodesulfovibrio sp. SB368]